MKVPFRISLASARVNAELTQDQVAGKMHKGKQTIINWEKGKTKIDSANFVVLCKLYKINPDYISLPKI